MSQLATIFTKIKEDFVKNHLREENKEKYQLVFSPFSTGFDYDDFLFLDTNSAAEEARTYLDELYEFSQMANTLPRENNFWTISGDQKDYLFNAYGTILHGLRLMDPDTLTINMLYGHPVFEKAINTLEGEAYDTYRSFRKLQKKLKEEINELQQNTSSSDETTTSLEIEMKEQNLKKIEKEWTDAGNKDKVEKEILVIIKDEFKRFMNRFIDTKSKLESSRRTRIEETFYYTSCTPNNLYRGNEVDWKKIEIGKQELNTLLESVNEQEYSEVFGGSELADIDIEKIEFELLFAHITRPWFDESVLRSPFWNIHILNKEDIHIPKITSKLIFIRNVTIKLPRQSQKNQRLLQKDQIQNLGPFIINTGQLKAGQNLRLKSVNTALNIDRKTVVNVAAKLESKEKRSGKSAKNIIAKKQRQFVTLAPRLQTNVKVKTEPKRQVKAIPKTFLKAMNPVLLSKKIVFHKVRSEFIFTEKGTRTPVKVTPHDIKILINNKPAKVTFSNKQINILIADLIAKKRYELQVNVSGYKPLKITFALSSREKTKLFRRHINLEKEAEKTEEINVEGLQLIGVVAKKIAPFPNPIKDADYI